jgi:hypothetical protein
MSATNYLELKLLDLVLGEIAFTSPATVYLALHTADPTEVGNVAEVSGNAYARVAVTNNATNFPAASGGSKSLNVDQTFPTPTPAGWGVVTHFSIWDASSAGNCLIYGALTASKTINAGDVVKFTATNLTVTMD